eukprot:Gb_39293 [translate_table: standard]
MKRGFVRVSGAYLHSDGAPRLPLILFSGSDLMVEDHRLEASIGEEGNLRIEGIHVWRITWRSKFLHEFVSLDDYGAFYGLNGNGGCLCLVFLQQCMAASLFPPFWH